MPRKRSPLDWEIAAHGPIREGAENIFNAPARRIRRREFSLAPGPKRKKHGYGRFAKKDFEK
jgi:hypothetical protein